MSHKTTKRLVSLIALFMLVATTPLSVLAQEEDVKPEATENQVQPDGNTPPPPKEEDTPPPREKVDEDGNVINPESAVENIFKRLRDRKASDRPVSDVVKKVIQSLDGKSEDRVFNAIEGVDKDIQEKIKELLDQLKENPGQAQDIREKIEELKKVPRQLKARAFEKNSDLIDRFKKVKRMPHLYEVRWGVLTGKRERCKSISDDLIEKSLEDGEIPESCLDKDNTQTYKGTISVDKGTLKIAKKILFENNDKIVTESGASVEFESTINGHWDGFALQYMPESDEAEMDGSNDHSKVKITVSIGNLNKTYEGTQALGRRQIGNGHMMEIKNIANIFSGMDRKIQDKIIKNKVQIKEKIGKVQRKLEEVQLLAGDGQGVDDIEELLEEVDEYNFDEITTEEIQAEMDLLVADLDENKDNQKVRSRARRLSKKVEALKEKAKDRKFKKKLIPFKDTDDDDWFTEFVTKAKNKGIFSGYKDKEGNELGEFRPGNNITVAEILKVGLETANKGKSDDSSDPKVKAAAGHWAKKYVKRGEELGLAIVKNKDEDLNRPATRGEVIRMILESLDIEPDEVTKTDFSDVSKNHPQARYIQHAKQLGLISGDKGKDTFRPNDPINRAEASKITSQVIENLLGGQEGEE